MAFFECHVSSSALGKCTCFNMLMPQDPPAPPKVLYLLHGLSDDHTIWMRRTSIERYASQYNLAVVMPDGARSWYSDTTDGSGYWTYLSEELPQLLHGMFNVSEKREDTFVAGLSMGGYGAFKLALNQPERFAAAVSLSGALLLDKLWGTWDNLLLVDLGPQENFAGSVADLAGKATSLASSGKTCPRLLQICGTEDFLYQVNLDFRDLVTGLRLPLEYREAPGSHNWDFWDCHIQESLEWMLGGLPGK